MPVLGIDISHYDGDWDARKAKEAGAIFVFVKSSQSNFTDSQFVASWGKAKRAGLLRGAYHYMDYTKPAHTQADYFADLLDADPGELPPVVDFEENVKQNQAVVPLKYLRAFVEQLHSRGYAPIIYTSPAFWGTYGSSDAYWRRYPLWIAHYTSARSPSVPAPWKTWTFWQYSAKGNGTLYGSDSYDMDMNWFNGNLEDLYAISRNYNPDMDVTQRVTGLEKRMNKVEQSVGQILARLDDIIARLPADPPPDPSPDPDPDPVPDPDPDPAPDPAPDPDPAPQPDPEPDPPPVEERIYGVCTAAQALYVRQGPGIVFEPVGYILHGQRVRILEQQDGWARLEEPAGWSSLKYLRLEKESAPVDDLPSDELPVDEPPDDDPNAPDLVLPDAPGVYALCQSDDAVIRSGPSEGYAVKGHLQRNAVVQVSEQKNGWAHIQPQDGWVRLDDLQIAVEAVVQARSLNVREGPGSDHLATDWLVYGQTVKIIQMEDEWSYIYAPSGWCMDAYLERQYSPSAAQYALSIARGLEVYQDSNQSSKLEGSLAFGQRVKILEEKDGWTRVQAPVGWCSNRYLQFKS